ncbi:MAG: hypothetical protein CMJ80_08925 [Planctomycetaceae bacterium]|nr:hypothetical protein [Planctomycetaceae bacterium]
MKDVTVVDRTRAVGCLRSECLARSCWARIRVSRQLWTARDDLIQASRRIDTCRSQILAKRPAEFRAKISRTAVDEIAQFLLTQFQGKRV